MNERSHSEYFILTSNSADNNTTLDWKLFVPKSEGYRMKFFNDFFTVKYEMGFFEFSQVHKLNIGMTRGEIFRARFLTNYQLLGKHQLFYLISTRRPVSFERGQKERRFRFYYEEANNILFQSYSC